MSAEHTILALTKRSHEVAKNNGFVENGKTHPFYRDANLFWSETAEALEDHRAGRAPTEVYYMHKEGGVSVRVPHEGLSREALSKLKPCGIPSELADVVIRICQRCGTEGTGEFLDACFLENVPVALSADFEEFLSFVNQDVAKALEAADCRVRRVSHLADALHRLFGYCVIKGIDLWAAIDEKEAFNRTRPFKHGGKLL